MVVLSGRKDITFLILVLIFLSGLLGRIFFTYKFPQSFVYDQVVYQSIAQNMSQKLFYSDPYRSYGYPLFISLLQQFFHSQDRAVWVAAQSLLDTAAGILIYLIGIKIYRNKLLPFISCIIYMVNPFTGVYAGLLLSETLMVFTLTLVLYLFTGLLVAKKRATNLILFSFFAGFLPQIKPAFILFSIILLAYTIRFFIRQYEKKYQKICLVILAMISLIIPFIYPVVGNSLYYGHITSLPVENNFIKEFYISLYEERPYDYLSRALPGEVVEVNQNYHNWHKEYRDSIESKYLRLSVEEIVKNPSKFVIWRLQKMWYVWEKHLVFPYGDYRGKMSESINYWANIVLLSSAVWGVYLWRKNDAHRKDQKRFFGIILLLIFYTTLVHSLSLADERYTIPVYPMMILFSGYFWGSFIRIFSTY